MIRQVKIIYLICFSLMLGGFYNNETGWEYNQSTFQAFYMFENLTVDDWPSVGDGCAPNQIAGCDGSCCSEDSCGGNLNTCDVVGAFLNDVCIGWVYSDSQGYTTVPVMGNDGTFPDYPSSGDIMEFKLYDATYGTILDITPGAAIPGWENFGIQIIEGTSTAENDLSFGCTDLDACNYDEDAIVDDGTCIYPPESLEIQQQVFENSVTLTWQDPEGLAPFTYFFEGQQVESPLTINDLEWSIVHQIIIETEDANIFYCEDSVETIVLVEIGDEPLPEMVSGLVETSTQGMVMLDWNDVESHMEYYNVYVSNLNGDSLEILSTSSSNFIHDNLLPNFTYEYRVSAVNSQGNEGPLSDAIQSTTAPLHEVVLDTLEPGQASIRLNWSVDENNYNDHGYIFDIYQDGVYSNSTSSISNSFLANDLNPGQEYCFYVVPKINADYLDIETVEYGSSSNTLCALPEEITGWSVQATFNVDGWAGIDPVSDNNNEVGMHPDATDLFDPSLDILEPMPSPGQWASLYFPHPEWYADLGDNFTSDFRELRDLSNQLMVWDGEFISDQPGPAQFGFSFINEAGGWPVYLKLQETSELESFNYYRISNNDMIDFFYLPENQVRSLQIIVGNSYPGPPTEVIAEGGARKIDLYWEQRDLCTFDELICNDANNRYPATGYKIFRDSQLKYLISYVDHEISFVIDQIYVNDDETDISISSYPENGEIVFDCYESYTDLNANGQYDIGDDFLDCGDDGLCSGDEGYMESDQGEEDGICNRYIQYTPNLGFEGEDVMTISSSQYGDQDIVVTTVSDMIYHYSDEGLFGSYLYNYYMLAYNHAGDSTPSLLASDVTDPNAIPIANGGLDQVFYLYQEGAIDTLVTLPLNIDGTNNNLSYDADAFDDEYLVYSWEKLIDDDWSVISESPSFDMVLEIAPHYFRHRVMDVSGVWSEYDDVLVDVRGLPEPAQIEELYINPDLYYLELSWDLSEYTEGNFPEGYDGEPMIASKYEIYYQGEDTPIVILEEVDENDICVQTYYLDNALTPETQYCYEIYGVNVQGLKSLVQTNCAFTGSYPSVEILDPNGGEILVSNLQYLMHWNIDNAQFVDNIEIFHTSDTQNPSWQSIFYSDQLSSASAIQVPDIQGITSDNLFKAVIKDRGDFYGNDIGSYSDQSDNRFIISNNYLEHNLDYGVNTIGAPMNPSLSLLDENLTDNDNLGFWLAFDQYGDNAADAHLDPGVGFYIISVQDIDNAFFALEGEIITQEARVELNAGWNLISNPLVATLNLDDLRIGNEEVEYSWQEAINLGFVISPLLIGYNNSESIHEISSQIKPFEGYWIHTPAEGMELIFNSYPYDEEYTYNNPLDEWGWRLILTASEENANPPQFSIRDFIVLAMDSQADEQFTYGEDLYDIPATVSSKYSNLYIDHNQDWYSSNLSDENGVIVESPRFMVDVRTPMQVGDFKEWKIRGELLGQINASTLIRLDWDMDQTVGNYPITLFAGDSQVDMRSVNSTVVLGADFIDMSIHMGETLSNDANIVSDFILNDVYPNPFNPTATLNLNIPSSDNLSVMIYDISGNHISTLHNGFIHSGEHNIQWDAHSVSSGVYFFKAEYKDNIVVKKAILIK